MAYVVRKTGSDISENLVMDFINKQVEIETLNSILKMIYILD